MRRALQLVALSMALGGCIAQGGVHVSDVVHESGGAHVAAAGQIGAAVEYEHWYVGSELEGRIERHGGGLLTAGIQAGAATDGEDRVNAILHLDLGTPLGWSNVEGWYVGSTFALPIRLSDPLPLATRNRRLRVIGSSPELAPYVRVRLFRLRPASVWEETTELSIGVALRLKFETDLL